MTSVCRFGRFDQRAKDVIKDTSEMKMECHGMGAKITLVTLKKSCYA